jgi:hypothetical protein
MGLGRIFENIVDAVTGNKNNDEDTNTNVSGGYAQDQGVLPASQDPLGDPADAQYNNAAYGGGGDILPASEDPLGDPADDGQYVSGQYDNATGDILPASEDPLGDPADNRY